MGFFLRVFGIFGIMYTAQTVRKVKRLLAVHDIESRRFQIDEFGKGLAKLPDVYGII